MSRRTSVPIPQKFAVQIPCPAHELMMNFNYNFWKAAQSDVFISFQLGVSSHESATPVKLVHNAVGHLNGSARTIGAAVIGYLGECRIKKK